MNAVLCLSYHGPTVPASQFEIVFEHEAFGEQTCGQCPHGIYWCRLRDQRRVHHLGMVAGTGIGRELVVASSRFVLAETAGSAEYSTGARQDLTLSMGRTLNQIGPRKIGKLTRSGSGTNPVKSISHVSRGLHSLEDEVGSLSLPLPFPVALTPHPVPILPQSSTFIFCMLRSVQSTVPGVERSSRTKTGFIEGR